VQAGVGRAAVPGPGGQQQAIEGDLRIVNHLYYLRLQVDPRRRRAQPDLDVAFGPEVRGPDQAVPERRLAAQERLRQGRALVRVVRLGADQDDVAVEPPLAQGRRGRPTGHAGADHHEPPGHGPRSLLSAGRPPRGYARISTTSPSANRWSRPTRWPGNRTDGPHTLAPCDRSNSSRCSAPATSATVAPGRTAIGSASVEPGRLVNTRTSPVKAHTSSRNASRLASSSTETPTTRRSGTAER